MIITAPIARLATGLCLLAALPTALADELVVPTQVVTLDTLPALEPLVVPRFDPALGVLQCVEVAVVGDVNGGYGFENLSNFPCTVGSNLTVHLSLLPRNEFVYLTECEISNGPRSANLSGFDGADDCSGSSGVNYAVNFDGSCNGLQICGVDMQRFVGTPGNAGVVNLRAFGTMDFSQNSQCIPNTCDSISADMQITVTYRYTAGTPDAAVTDEDQCVQIDVLANDCLSGSGACSDCACNLDASTVAILTGAAHGQAHHLGDGIVEYCPNDDYCGTDQFTYRVADGAGNYTPPITVDVTVNPLNDCPVAVDDAESVLEDSTVLVLVLANDTDADGASCGSALDPTSVTIMVPPTHGTAVPDAQGRVLYTPNPGFCGADSFRYRLDDGTCESDLALVSIDVTPLNDDPVAQDDAAGVSEGSTVLIAILANDFDPDELGGCGALLDHSSVEVLTQPTLGGFQVLENGKLRYGSTKGLCGVDSFTYRVFDLAGSPSQPATVTVTVNAVNEPPLAMPDNATLSEGGSLLIPVTANDSDADDGSGCGGALVPGSVLVTTPAANGVAVPNGSGGVNYTPDAGFCGIDQFQYTVADEDGAVSSPAVVQVDVLAVNECPITVDDVATTPEGTAIGIVVLANDFDPDQGTNCGAVILPASVSVVAQPAHGTTQVNAGGKVIYTPAEGYCGPDGFTYLISDSDGCISETASVAIEVTPVNVCPIAAADAAELGEGLSITIPVAANDSDADDATDCGGGLVPASVQGESGPANGTATPDGAGGVTYTPNFGFCGADGFTYTIADEDGCRSEAAAVSITVAPINEAPVASADHATTTEDVAILIAVLVNDVDADDLSGCGAGIAPETVEIVSAPAHGTAIPDGLGGVTYTPEGDFCGIDEFYYRVADAEGEFSGPTSVGVKVVGDNDCPIAGPDHANTLEDTPVLIDVLQNDGDVDTGTECGAGLESATIVFTALPRHGTITVDPSGGVLYDPDADFCGRDVFRYSVADGAGCVSAPVSVVVQVAPDEDCPVALDDSYEVNELSVVYFEVLANDYDPDGAGSCGGVIDPSTVTIVSSPSRASVSVEPDGRVRYEGLPQECGGDSFCYTVTDESGCVSNEATVVVHIAAVNSQPVALDDFVESEEGQAVEFDVLKSGLPEEDYDPDGTSVCGAPLDPCSVQMVKPIQGELTLGTIQELGCGLFIYTPFEEPGAGQTLVDHFRYTVKDTDLLESEPARVTIQLLGAEPEPPVANDDYATTNWPAPVEIDVLANDTDPNGDILPGSVVVLQQPDCGTAEVLANGVILFTPGTDACGECSFTYGVQDVTSLEATATVTVDILCECASGPRDRRRPGSLLLYPQYDSRPGSLSYITVTNTSATQGVKVKYQYVNGEDCQRFNRTETLTPNDTLTVIAENHVPDTEQGYLYLYAQSLDTNQPIVHNALIGQVLILDGVAMFGIECNAVSFRGVGANGIPTDFDSDGIRDLNGIEYEEAPGEILIPRFFGQIEGQVRSELILVALTGGTSFSTGLYFEIYNDNEVTFSREYEFSCWDRVALLDLAGATSNQFLSLLGDDDPSEVVGASGAIQAGWIRIRGEYAQSNSTVIPEPAFYAMLVESTSIDMASSDLPFEFCSKDNGDLLPHGLLGDQD
ncbi:MAG: tandem-95 repeat protein [Planctomycetes bacterium]|nr:tandem-95 repeat protein [Planctomycetota bacterium]